MTVPVDANTTAYNTLWQVRADTWSSLEETASQLVLAGTGQRAFEQPFETVTGLLDTLGPIERLWAFPGTQAIQKLRLLAAGNYGRFARLVSEIDRALATGSYRGGHILDMGTEDEAVDRLINPADQARTDRPYFEVLVVEDMTEQQESSLREEMRRLRRPDDPFIYEIVVVPSFDDAVMAARLNFRLQAVVVRRRFTRRSRHDSSSLAQFAYSGGSADLMERSPDERAQ